MFRIFIHILMHFRNLWRGLRADPDSAAIGVLLSGLLGIGMCFYHWVEGWGWVDSLYFCVMTVATVGFGGLAPTTTLFMLGASFLLGGLKHHVQEYNRVGARVQAGLLFLATVAMLVPSGVAMTDPAVSSMMNVELSVGLSILLITTYGLGMLFSLKIHKEMMADEHGRHGEIKEEEPGRLAWRWVFWLGSPCWSLWSARCSWNLCRWHPSVLA